MHRDEVGGEVCIFFKRVQVVEVGWGRGGYVCLFADCGVDEEVCRGEGAGVADGS